MLQAALSIAADTADCRCAVLIAQALGFADQRCVCFCSTVPHACAIINTLLDSDRATSQFTRLQMNRSMNIPVCTVSRAAETCCVSLAQFGLSTHHSFETATCASHMSSKSSVISCLNASHSTQVHYA